MCKTLNSVRGAVCAQGAKFERNFHLLKEIGCFAQYGQVGSAAHDYADSAIHIVWFIIRLKLRILL